MSLPTEPYSRIERYLAKLAGQEVDIPDKPITRIECYLDYIVNNGGGVPAANAGAHNGVFRGRPLGGEFTSSQSAAITGGTFDGLYVGDYWTIGEVVYRIAGFDIFLNTGYTPLPHHVVVVPDASLYTGQMNTEDTTDTGYFGSYMRQAGLSSAVSTVVSAFGAAHLITRPSLLVSAVSNGVPTAYKWADVSVDIMSEGQVLGRCVWGIPSQNGYNVGERYSQFPLFSLAPQYIRTTDSIDYWLQDVRNDACYSELRTNGAVAATALASLMAGVRPYFCIS